MADPMADGLLAGIRVIDLTHALAGPLCTHQLRAHGAEVIKIEPPGKGDDFRARPYGRFSCINGGKRSVTLNLKSEAGRKVLGDLLVRADVVIENFRPGVARDFGLDWDVLHEAFPGLTYCSISGFGQEGPMRDMPAIEWSAQSISGLSQNYLAENDDAMDLGIGMLDPMTGFIAFSAIVAALYRRAQTGEGSRIDVAMLDTAFLISSNNIASALMGGPSNLGRRPTMARYRTREGRLFIAALHPKWFEKLCRLIDRPGILTDPRFATPDARDRNGEALVDAIEQGLADKTALEWEGLLVEAGIPAGAARSFVEIANHPQTESRGILETFDSEEGRLRAVGAAVRLEGVPTRINGNVEPLGASTDSCLGELGYTAADIDRLRSEGAV